MSTQVEQFGWLVTSFTERVPGVSHAVVISTDGLLLLKSGCLSDDRAQQFAAIAAGVSSLADTASRCFAGDAVVRTVVQMERGVMLLMSIRDGACLAVLASADSDVSQVAYEMTVIVRQVGELLTPEMRAELHRA
ncbi:dynein regulation protein LC7 [Lentzea sp. NBRC 105346]|uniref:roadblock/LC7 domain-containing protein n=1 Tax=Lentzea sp. NBRC 105346 TaxID=3032205 RepID=UPI0024A09454|nr:roadblock/LC7 domain-containing protein [Lentzea sp. NBRC 105346]GLZ31048.1 dynein regulation protein LC7 [Lentzea sp. NBRC 105346]